MNILQSFLFISKLYFGELEKNIFHFAANKNHLGIYPTPEPIVFFQKELENYVTSKGAIIFPYNQEIPYELIEKIIEYQIRKNTV